MSGIIAIDKSIHQNIKIKSNPTLLQSKNKHFSPLVVQEFVAASQEFPIVFIKDSETGQFKAIALLGLKPQENLFYDETAWQARYKPEALALYPFLLSQNENDDSGILCIDDSSPLLNKIDGEALFDSKTNPTPWLSAQGERVVQYVEKGYATQHFIKILLDKDLLSPQTLNLTLENHDEYSLNGLYAIDEKKLDALSDECFSDLRKSGALSAIYASLLSMQCIHNLARLKIAKIV